MTMRPHTIRFRGVMRLDRTSRMLRLARLLWQRGAIGDGRGYSSSLSLALRPKVFERRRERDGWLLTLACIRLHYQRSWGGIQV